MMMIKDENKNGEDEVPPFFEADFFSRPSKSSRSTSRDEDL